jgi:5-deoxy-glucuronate isomerase
MKFGRLGELKHGYNVMTTRDSDMLMDIGYQLMDKDEKLIFQSDRLETAFVILEGQVQISWNDITETMCRDSVFDEKPYCLHVPAGLEVIIKADTASQVLIQQTENDTKFAPKFYHPEDVQSDQFGSGLWNGTAERTVRTIFDYDNAPYSNMVNGEVINRPGRWSGYIPHTHPQPEVYTYKFNKPQGFGACFIGENAFKISHNSWSELSGGNSHPQVTAPGYAMWYSWMIRHLPGNPWEKTRTDDTDHTWLLEDNAKIWPEK